MNDEDLEVMPDFLDGMFSKLGVTGEPATAKVAVANSRDYHIDEMIEDRVCGLLLKDELTVEEIALLAALLRRPM